MHVPTCRCHGIQAHLPSVMIETQEETLGKVWDISLILVEVCITRYMGPLH